MSHPAVNREHATDFGISTAILVLGSARKGSKLGLMLLSTLKITRTCHQETYLGSSDYSLVRCCRNISYHLVASRTLRPTKSYLA